MDFSAENWTLQTWSQACFNFHEMTCELRLDPHSVCYFQQLLDSARKGRRGQMHRNKGPLRNKRTRKRRKMRQECLLLCLRDCRQHEPDLDCKTLKLLSAHKPNTHIVHSSTGSSHIVCISICLVNDFKN